MIGSTLPLSARSLVPGLNAISDMSNVSARTAGYIRSLIKKGDKYIKALIKHARVIREGSGERVIARLIKSELEGKTNKNATIIESLVYNEKKLDIFSNGKIQFSKPTYEHEDYKKFLLEIKTLFEKYYSQNNE